MLVFILALTNAAFLLWQFYRPQPEQPSWEPADPGIEKLVLLREAERGPSAVAPSSEAPTQAAAEKPSPAAGEAVTATQDQQTPAETQRSGDERSQPVPASQAVAASVECYSAGPFAERGQAEAAVARLHPHATEGHIRVQEDTVKRYWVYLPPRPNLGAAQRDERRLRGLGISDLQVLGADGKRNAISLGLFSERDSARRRLDQISGFGFSPIVEELEQSRRRYWVDFASRATAGAETGQRTPAERFPELEIQGRPCE